MLDPQLAAVRPRVVLPDVEGPVLLEEEIQDRLDDGQCGVIVLAGAHGCGKSTALAHLAERFQDDSRLFLADCEDFHTTQVLAHAASQLVVCALPTSALTYTKQRWNLAPWTRDEWIEYLLAISPEQCASVMARMQSDADASKLGGSPELCSAVLDQMAQDESLVEIKSALRRALNARLAAPTELVPLREWCFTALVNSDVAVANLESLGKRHDVAPAAKLLACHQPVQILLAADHLSVALKSGRALSLLAIQVPPSILHETARLIRDDRKVLGRLRSTVAAERHRRWHSMAASLLAAADVGWVPNSGRAPLFVAAELARVRWPGIMLTDVDFSNANLSHADLTEARLQQVVALGARFNHATLRGAQVSEFSAIKADFTAADLSYARAESAIFQRARLAGANLEGALCTGAKFTAADLSGARCCRGNFSHAEFMRATLTGADFSQANLSSARLYRQSLREANFTGADFSRAVLRYCDLEYVRLPGANFHCADLEGAHLTGSHMPGACFRNADLKHTGLADIEWEGADLRGADLRGATFHLGSSRSGLVESPIACEGSRTGFYTDEYVEQGFKSPEEIRKANLRGADLRGAKIDDVDFYLVDLRDAIFTPDQEDHFRRCRAILETRVE